MLELNYKTYGHGPALIILHGLFGSLDNWGSMARRFAENFTVYIVDQRNHGKSPHHPDWDYPVMAHDLGDFMDQHGIRTANLIGHSMGGKVVMQFANEHPQRIEKMVVADMAPITYQPHHSRIIEALNDLDLSQLEDRSDADEELKVGIPHPSVRQFLLKNLGRTQDKSFRWKFNLEVITQKYEEVLKGVNVEIPFHGEVLFLYGENSEYVVPSYEKVIREYFPKAKFEGIEGAGHWLHADSPEEFYQKCEAFFKA